MSDSRPPAYYSLDTVLYFMNSHVEGISDHAQYLRAAIRDDMTTVRLGLDWTMKD